jgi:hypothetical protein
MTTKRAAKHARTPHARDHNPMRATSPACGNCGFSGATAAITPGAAAPAGQHDDHLPNAPALHD